MSDSGDTVVLRTAGGRCALPLLRVFISGYACRHDLSVDRLDDLQLAVETVLAEERGEADELLVEISRKGDAITVRVEGLRNQSVKAALLATERFHPSADCLLDVRVLLQSLVDSYRVSNADDASFGLEMDKRTA